MAEPHTVTPLPITKVIPPLVAGERLAQQTFHERYEAMPPNTWAELVGGVVYMPSPMKDHHGRTTPRVTTWLMHYQMATPGTDVLDNATTILGPESEPQPDSCILILPEFGGQTSVDDDGYLCGAPELVTEIAYSTEGFDLGSKFRDYQQAGVREYLVVLLRRRQVRWFVLRDGNFHDLPLSDDGFFHSEVFPGLWLHPEAMLANDTRRVIEVLNQGLASPPHAQFLERLRRR
jgi:hypothetical protein